MKLLPLGTVLKINNHKVFIIGYTSTEKDGKSVLGYFVVPYPLGFINIDKVFFIPYREDYEVLAEGYATDTSRQLLGRLAKTFTMAENLSTEQLAAINKAIQLAASKKEGAEK